MGTDTGTGGHYTSGTYRCPLELWRDGSRGSETGDPLAPRAARDTRPRGMLVLWLVRWSEEAAHEHKPSEQAICIYSRAHCHAEDVFSQHHTSSLHAFQRSNNFFELLQLLNNVPVFNSVCTIMFYMTRQTKLNLTCLCFKKNILVAIYV
jgi:hypothetical protein